MTQYKLTVGDSNTGYTDVMVGIGQAPRTGAQVPTFPKGWRKGLNRNHADVLFAAAHELAHSFSFSATHEIPKNLGGATRTGDSLPVRCVKVV